MRWSKDGTGGKGAGERLCGWRANESFAAISDLVPRHLNNQLLYWISHDLQLIEQPKATRSKTGSSIDRMRRPQGVSNGPADG